MRQPRRRLTDQDAVLRSVPERQFQDGIMEAALYLGWLVYHVSDSRLDAPGFPDLVMVHPIQGRCVFAELKREQGRFSPHQLMWLGALMSCQGVETYSWKPRDIDRILEILQARPA